MVRINNAESERLILQANNQNVSIISLNSKNCAQNMKGRWDESEFSGGSYLEFLVSLHRIQQVTNIF